MQYFQQSLVTTGHHICVNVCQIEITVIQERARVEGTTPEAHPILLGQFVKVGRWPCSPSKRLLAVRVKWNNIIGKLDQKKDAKDNLTLWKTKPIELGCLIEAFSQWQSDITSISLFFPPSPVYTLLTSNSLHHSIALLCILPTSGSCNSLSTPHPPTSKGHHYRSNDFCWHICWLPLSGFPNENMMVLGVETVCKVQHTFPSTVSGVSLHNWYLWGLSPML